MNKKILPFICAVALGLGFFSVKSQVAKTETPLKNEAQSVKAKAEDKLERVEEIKFTDLNEVQLRLKLEQLDAVLENNKVKNYVDFSKEEIQKYNEQVRESVRIKKTLFLKKYAHWSNL